MQENLRRRPNGENSAFWPPYPARNLGLRSFLFSLRAVAEETIRAEAKWRIAVGSALSSSSDRSSQLFYGQGEAVFPPPATTFFFLWRASLPRQQSDLLPSLSPPLAAIFWVDEQRHPR